jgi:hypothetical protein
MNTKSQIYVLLSTHVQHWNGLKIMSIRTVKTLDESGRCG